MIVFCHKMLIFLKSGKVYTKNVNKHHIQVDCGWFYYIPVLADFFIIIIFDILNLKTNLIPIWKNKKVFFQNLSQYLRKACIKAEHAEPLENFTKLSIISLIKDLGQQVGCTAPVHTD